MELPLLLAGPILRRVDPSIVSVWMALSSDATVRLDVYEGRVAFDTTNPVFVSSDDAPDPNAPKPYPGADTIRIGERLHLSLVSARIPPASGKVFEADRLYSYNITIFASGAMPLAPLVAGLGLGLVGRTWTLVATAAICLAAAGLAASTRSLRELPAESGWVAHAVANGTPAEAAEATTPEQQPAGQG